MAPGSGSEAVALPGVGARSLELLAGRCCRGESGLSHSCPAAGLPLAYLSASGAWPGAGFQEMRVVLVETAFTFRRHPAPRAEIQSWHGAQQELR